MGGYIAAAAPTVALPLGKLWLRLNGLRAAINALHCDSCTSVRFHSHSYNTIDLLLTSYVAYGGAGGVFGLACEAPSGGILLHSRFNDPHAGTIDEHFYLNSADTLHVDAVMKVGQGRVQYRQVYRRQL